MAEKSIINIRFINEDSDYINCIEIDLNDGTKFSVISGDSPDYMVFHLYNPQEKTWKLLSEEEVEVIIGAVNCLNTK